MTWLLLVLGLIGGAFSGLLGLGGAVLMVPLLLFVPQMFGQQPLDMRQVAAISIVQVFFASLSAVIVHWRHGYVSRTVVGWVGIPAGLASFAGAWFSARTSSRELEIIFAAISTLAFFIMIRPLPQQPESEGMSEPRFSHAAAVVIAVVVGGVGGLVGAPGAFIFVPLLIYALKIPARITLGSTLFIVLIGSVAGVLGKVDTHQVDWALALPLAAGSVAGAQFGGWLSARTRVEVLRWALVALIGFSTARIWMGI